MLEKVLVIFLVQLLVVNHWFGGLEIGFFCFFLTCRCGKGISTVGVVEWRSTLSITFPFYFQDDHFFDHTVIPTFSFFRKKQKFKVLGYQLHRKVDSNCIIALFNATFTTYNNTKRTTIMLANNTCTVRVDELLTYYSNIFFKIN